jgi:taurine dioxygenase
MGSNLMMVPAQSHYEKLTVTPMQAALGAEIEGVDLSQGISPAVINEIKRAFLEYQVICFRDQTLTPAQHLKFASYFGEIDTYPFAEHIPDYPGVVAIVKEPQTELNFGGVWHSDSPYLEKPPMGTVLYGVEIPENGGDTLFASMYEAYESLSSGMKKMLAEQTGVFSACCVHMNEDLKLGDVIRKKNVELAMAEQLHPMVRTHPETGRKSVFISRVHVQRFSDMTEMESAPILDSLASIVTQPQFTMRLQWRKGTVVVWDNRCVQHYALNDYPGRRREVHRVVIRGSRPV